MIISKGIYRRLCTVDTGEGMERCVPALLVRDAGAYGCHSAGADGDVSAGAEHVEATERLFRGNVPRELGPRVPARALRLAHDELGLLVHAAEEARERAELGGDPRKGGAARGGPLAAEDVRAVAPARLARARLLAGGDDKGGLLGDEVERVRGAEDDGRETARHRLHHAQAIPLRPRRVNEHVRRCVQRRELAAREHARDHLNLGRAGLAAVVLLRPQARKPIRPATCAGAVALFVVLRLRSDIPLEQRLDLLVAV
mmetsp:Transcript_5998/g.20267  ORF Transcript_5998/g.20267 Transcript_5998/m.20267 type:complete len:257 (+) Transcript_5998:23-793(+)